MNAISYIPLDVRTVEKNVRGGAIGGSNEENSWVVIGGAGASTASSALLFLTGLGVPFSRVFMTLRYAGERKSMLIT